MNAADFPGLTMAQALEQLAAFPAFLEGAIAGKDAQALRRQPKPGEFSLVEHACHLRDLEREGYALRLERMLAEEVPDLEGFDGGAVAAARDYPAQDAAAAARAFAAARCGFVATASALPSDILAREAVFFGKRITVCGLLGLMAAHDAGHRTEIEALVREPGATPD